MECLLCAHLLCAQCCGQSRGNHGSPGLPGGRRRWGCYYFHCHEGQLISPQQQLFTASLSPSAGQAALVTSGAKERRKPSCIGTGGREQSRSLSKSDRNERERVRSLTEQSCGQSRFSLPQSSQSQENARRLTGIHKNSNPGLINVSKQFNDLL